MQSLWSQLRTEEAADVYADLDIRSVDEIVALMNDADKSVAFAVEQVTKDIVAAIELVVEKMQSGGRLIYVGAGTSGRLGVLDAAECPPTFNTSPELVQAVLAGGRDAMFEAVEHAEDDVQLGHRDLARINLTNADVIVGITASGGTPYVMGALEYARSLGAGTVALSCNRHARVSDLADVAIEVDTGPEVVMGSTRLKAGTAEKMILNMMSTTTMVRLGKVYQNLMVDLRATNYKLIERSKRIHMRVTGSTYEEASGALEEAEGSLKTSIVMTKRNVDRQTAAKLLKDSNQFLRQALEETP